jgi:tetratricopeptide (TPR) repeat protein
MDGEPQREHEPTTPAEASPTQASAPTAVLTLSATEKIGDRIGRYKLLQEIGEGGCGVVYMAEQEEPVRRRVALKVIKLGMDTKSVIARFEAERQALALMDHPNIAKVLDAGATEKGRPFFVMELVRGIPISDYCDQNKLETEPRLKLFIQVCQAIQHAHQKGIIHRDIKPSNILVTLHDGVPVPKVIDFGIAKATQGRLTNQTLFTAFEQFIGTPAYMSPEQAEMSGLDIDTRSDIYALGVLLYELLTGQTPFDTKMLLAAGLDKLRQTIREQEPARPSTRLRTMLDADLDTTARHRHTEPPKLIHLLRGDLDWIVMKTLEKDRTRRYETASGLAMDVERYLNREPVVARPPSRLYRFQKLVQRNRIMVGAAAMALLALFAGLGLSLYLFVRERAARQRAVAAEREQARLRVQAEKSLELELKLRESAQLSDKLTAASRLVGEGKFDAAEKLLYESPLHPAAAPMLNTIGLGHVRRGEWLPAITNFSDIVNLVPTEHLPYFYLGPLLAQVGDLQGYQRNCERMIRLFATNRAPAIAERVARAAFIIPPPTEDLPELSKLADVIFTAPPKQRSSAIFLFVQGLAEYRAGHLNNALDWLQQAAAQPQEELHLVEVLMVLAMTQQKLQQAEAAKATLARGLHVAESAMPGGANRDLGLKWQEVIGARLLMKEAKGVIDNAAASKGNER